MHTLHFYFILTIIELQLFKISPVLFKILKVGIEFKDGSLIFNVFV